MALAVQGVLFAFTAFGVGAYIIREVNLSRDTLARAFTVNLGLAIALFVGLNIAAQLSQMAGVDYQIERVLRILSVGPLIGAVELVPMALLSREMNYKALAMAGLARSAVTAVVSILLVYFGSGAGGLAIGQVTGGAASALVIAALRPRDVVFRPTRRELWPIVKFGAQLMSIGGVAQLSSRLSDLVLGRLLGLSALGTYARASNIYQMIFENVYGLLTGVFFSKMSGDMRATGDIGQFYLRGLALITGILWPALIGIAVVARPLIYNLYGEQWVAAAQPLAVLMVAQFVALGYSMNLELFILRHETARQTRFEMIRGLFGIIAFSTGALFSITAAAFGRLAEAAVGYLLYRPHVQRLAGVNGHDLRRVYGDSLLLTGAAVTPATLVMTYASWRATVHPALIGTAIGAGVVLWLGMLVVRNHVIANEIKALLRLMLIRSK